MMRRVTIAALVTACLSGCSWLFVQRLPQDYDGNSEPRCSTSKTPVVFDALIVLLDAAAITYLIQHGNEPGEDVGLEIGLNATEALVHTVSGVMGDGWVNECRRAKRDYAATFELRARESTPIVPPRDVVEPGYFCTSSPVDSAIGACNRSADRCVASQAKLRARGHDVGPCVRMQAAICFAVTKGDDRQLGCAPSFASCERHREMAATSQPEANVGPCENAPINR